MKRALKLAAPALILGAFLGASNIEAQSEFPHEKHSIFFSDCTACHAGVSSGSFEGVYPEASFCTACHDGGTAPVIGWTTPEDPRPSNLGFEHAPHTAFDCTNCHIRGESDDLSAITFPRPSLCLGCHAPQAENHMAAVEECQTCHVPATESGSWATAPDGFPRPDSHRFSDFIRGHRAQAAASPDYCAICHTESSCTSCHEGQGAPAFHPMNFLADHAPEAYGRMNDCSSCHSAEAFCRTCHINLGINATGEAGVAYHDAESFWIQSHAPAARQDLESCVSCHQQTDCLRCHSAQMGLGVNPHGPNFNGSSISERNKAMCTLCHISGN